MTGTRGVSYSTVIVRTKATGRMPIVSPEVHPVQVHCSCRYADRHIRRYVVLFRASDEPTTALFGTVISLQLFCWGQ